MAGLFPAPCQARRLLASRAGAEQDLPALSDHTQALSCSPVHWGLPSTHPCFPQPGSSLQQEPAWSTDGTGENRALTVLRARAALTEEPPVAGPGLPELLTGCAGPASPQEQISALHLQHS